METQYDDALLVTQENLEHVDWDRIDSFGLVSEGKHLVEIEKVAGYLHNFKEYSGPRAKLKMRVLAGPDAGKYLYDDLNLPHLQEKAGNQNRRLLIASRLGLVPKGTKTAVGINWKLLEGRPAVVTVVHNKSEKDGKSSTYANNSFDGYEGPESWQTQPQAGGNGGAAGKWDDI
jgi:hypothetical protein